MTKTYYEVYSTTKNIIATFDNINEALKYAEQSSKNIKGPFVITKVKREEDCQYIDGKWHTI